MKKRSGKDLEKLNIPEPFEDLKPLLQAFSTLSASRNMNGRIPLTEIIAYAQTFGFQDLEEFVEIIQALDAKAAQLRDKGSQNGKIRNSKGGD